MDTRIGIIERDTHQMREQDSSPIESTNMSWHWIFSINNFILYCVACDLFWRRKANVASVFFNYNVKDTQQSYDSSFENMKIKHVVRMRFLLLASMWHIEFFDFELVVEISSECLVMKQQKDGYSIRSVTKNIQINIVWKRCGFPSKLSNRTDWEIMRILSICLDIIVRADEKCWHNLMNDHFNIKYSWCNQIDMTDETTE